MAASSIFRFIIASLLIGLSSIGLDNVGTHALAKPAALFVFGDSYADTGNHNQSDPSLNSSAWKVPYGNTWPGKPTGRFSDGRVLTDFYASALGVTKPVPYRVINITTDNIVKHKNGRSKSRAGVNFAFGGSGAFSTYGPQYLTFSAQINQLQDLIRRDMVSKKLIKTSTVLLVVAGNDYIAYQLQYSNATDINELIPKVVREMAMILDVLHNVGFRRIVATTMEPLGCLPLMISGNFTTCNLAINQWSSLHNSLLASHISALQSKHPSTDFVTLDLNSAFHTVITDTESPLTPCCFGVGGGGCGEVDENGGPLYTLCSSPNHALFWDLAHPTNAGWKKISQILFST